MRRQRRLSISSVSGNRLPHKRRRVQSFVAIHLVQSGHSFSSQLSLCQAILQGARERLEKFGLFDRLSTAAKAANAKQDSLSRGFSTAASVYEGALLSSKRKDLLTWYLKARRQKSDRDAAQVEHSKETHLFELTPPLKYEFNPKSRERLDFASHADRARFIAITERYGRTRGDVHFSERALQARELYEAGIASLYHFTDEENWKELVLQQPANVWLAAYLEASVARAELPPSKKQRGSKGQHRAVPYHRLFADQDSELHEEIAKAMSRKWLQQQSQRGLSRKSPLFLLHELDGSQVNINQKGQMTFRVQLPQSQECAVSVGVDQPSAPLYAEDIRTIHFTSAGVEIRTSNGEVLCPRGNEIHGSLLEDQAFPTFPKSRLQSLEGGKELLSVWKQLIGNTLQEKPVYVEPDIARGEPIPKSVPRGLTREKPLYEGDALWLLDQYLGQYFPDGGDIWLRDKDHFPQGTDDVDRFTR